MSNLEVAARTFSPPPSRGRKMRLGFCASQKPIAASGGGCITARSLLPTPPALALPLEGGGEGSGGRRGKASGVSDCWIESRQPRAPLSILFSHPPPLRGRAGAGGGRDRQQPKRVKQAHHYAVEVFANFPVPGAKNRVTARLQPRGSLSILSRNRRIGVLHTIDLDDKSALEEHEVDDVSTHRVLPAKLQTGCPALSQLAPEDALFLGWSGSESSGGFFRHKQTRQQAHYSLFASHRH